MSTSLLTSTTFVGLDIAITRAPTWETKVQENVSGHETRVTTRQSPRYTWTGKFNFLRNSTAYPGFGNGSLDFQNFVGFFNALNGSYHSFLWLDPDDNAVTSQLLLNNGDGTGLNYQLVRNFGGFTENVYAPNVASSTTTIITRTDWQGVTQLLTTPRTNYAPFGEGLTSTSWPANFGSGENYGSTSIAAPDGTNTAAQLNFGSSGDFAASPSITVSTGASTFCFSIWLWSNVAGQTMSLKLDGNGITGNSASLTLTTTPTRYSVNWVPSTNQPLMRIGTRNLDGSGVGTATSAFAWGAQLEQSTAPTSLIYTPSTAAVTVTDYTLGLWNISSSPGLVQLGAVPLSSAVIQLTGSYYWPVRFDSDKLSFERLANNLWALKQVSFTSII